MFEQEMVPASPLPLGRSASGTCFASATTPGAGMKTRLEVPTTTSGAAPRPGSLISSGGHRGVARVSARCTGELGGQARIPRPAARLRTPCDERRPLRRDPRNVFRPRSAVDGLLQDEAMGW